MKIIHKVGQILTLNEEYENNTQYNIAAIEKHKKYPKASNKIFIINTF